MVPEPVMRIKLSAPPAICCHSYLYIYITDLGDDDEIVFQHNLNQINSFKLLLNHSFIPLHYNIHFFRNIFSQKSARTIERNGKEELDRGRRQSPICHFDSNQQSQPSS